MIVIKKIVIVIKKKEMISDSERIWISDWHKDKDRIRDKVSVSVKDRVCDRNKFLHLSTGRNRQSTQIPLPCCYCELELHGKPCLPESGMYTRKQNIQWTMFTMYTL